jgi:hypothetical protein
MKSVIKLITVLLALGATALHADELTDRFTNPPAEAKPWLYWYWMNGNVSREGIRADMQAFADVGIGGAITFDIGIFPAGTVTNRSREWYDLVKFATTEAAKHGIKMGFHSPGWSASGGPWITPELGMQELTWSETVVEGPRELATATLLQPRTHLDFYRDAAVIAFPTPAGDEPLPKPQLTDTDGKPLAANAATLPAEFDLVFSQPVEVRSAFVRVARATGAFTAELSAFDKSDGKSRPAAKFRSHLCGPFSANIGSASFVPVRARKFRLAFVGRKIHERVVVEQLELCSGYRLPDWTSKAGFATDRVDHRPTTPAPLSTDVIAPEKIMDITGRKTWSVPAGRWTILRLGHTPTGVHIAPAPLGGDGLECDKLSCEVADFHYDKCVTPVLREFGPELTKQTVAYYHVDSYEAGWQNWSAKFPQEFHARRGYDLLKYLPAVTGRVVGDLVTTEKFLWDFRRTIGDLYADNHYGQLAKRCHDDGIAFSTEPYGGPFECLQVGVRADHPMVEFWLPTKPQGKKITFHGVSAGHTAGRNIIGAESFTSGPPEEKWNSHPFSLKALGDFIYCCGVNRFVIHTSAQQPLVGDHFRPGFTCGQNGIHFDRANTWWQHGAKEWASYLARCQSLLQTGEHVADVLYFQGNDCPDGIGPFDPPLPDGYDFDACNSEVLEKLRVKNGWLMLPGGKSYRYLVLPRDGRITLASLRKIASLVKDGARIIGEFPKESPSLADDARGDEYDQLKKELTGRMRPKTPFNAILAADKLPPDFDFNETSGLVLHSIHRRAGDTDIYFVASASPRAGVADCRFRVSGKNPELWKADSGTPEPCPVFEQAGDVTRIPLRFDPAGSVFVVFRPGAAKVHATGVERVGEAGAPPSVLTIRSANYGPPNDVRRTVDVTKKISSRIENGKLKLRNFEQLAGDPAPGVVKLLRVEYELDGKSGVAMASDGEELRIPAPDEHLPPFELRDNGGKLELRAWKTGGYRVALSDGRTPALAIASVPAPQTIAGPWSVEFPAGWGAPAKITLPQLASWTEHSDPGVKYFSGTATYRTAFQSAIHNSKSQIILDLGRVEVIAEVWLNGKALGTLWKPPFRCDVTDTLRDGENDLEIRVTNLWPNRLIGDEQFPDDCVLKGAWRGGGIRAWPDWILKNQPRPEPRRQTFFTWKHWAKDDALLPSGLLGPVTLNTVETVEVK